MKHPQLRLFSSAILMLTLCGGARSGGQQSGANDLAGTSWQLVKFQGSDDRTLTPDERSKYTITLEPDGRVSARIDCNRGRGTWKSAGPNQIEFGPLALTRMMCPPGSLHDRIAKDWQYVRSYIQKDGHLFLSLMADGGIYEYEPMGGSTSASSPAPAVASDGPRAYDCAQAGGGNVQLKVTFYQTEPALALLQRGNETRPAFQVPSARRGEICRSGRYVLGEGRGSAGDLGRSRFEVQPAPALMSSDWQS